MNIHLTDYGTEEVMTPGDWLHVEHFNVTENWGSPYKMNVYLIFYVDLFRSLLGYPVDVYNAYETRGHSPTGMHPKGRAVDCSPAQEVSLVDAFMTAMRLPFSGVGLYKWWKPRAGLHLDVKPLSYSQPKRFWYRDKFGIYHNIRSFSDIHSCLNEA